MMSTPIRLVLTFVAMFPLLSFAQSESFKVHETIANKAQEFVRVVSSEAVVTVEIKFKQSTIDLPGVPFTVSEKNTSLVNEIELIQFRIFSELATLPLALKEELQELGGQYTPNVEINLKTISLAESGYSWDQRLRLLASRWAWLTMIASLLILAGAYFSLNFYKLLSEKKNQSILHSTLENLSSKFEAKSGPALSREKEILSNSGIEGNRPPANPLEGDSGVVQRLNDMNSDSLVSFLFDCYWTQKDGKAAYVWRLINVENQSKIIGESESMRYYCQFLQAIAQEKNNDFQDIAYLNPLPLNHLSQSDLSMKLGLYPSLLNELSELRRTSLELTGVEFLELRKSAKAMTPKARKEIESVLSKMPESSPRIIVLGGSLPIKSFEDEESLIALKDLDIETKEQINSLAWLLEVEESVLTEFLTQFSAVELAEAWVGPERILNLIGDRLSDKKKKRVLSYLNQVVPSRTSTSFKSLHSWSIQMLKDQQNGPSLEKVFDHEDTKLAS